MAHNPNCHEGKLQDFSDKAMIGYFKVLLNSAKIKKESHFSVKSLDKEWKSRGTRTRNLQITSLTP